MERILLLVDDEEAIGSSLERMLRPDGYTILRAKGGKEGLELLTQYTVGVIVSDQRMPEMTGVEFLSCVKDLYPNTVRIILSGYTDFNAVTEAFNRGAICNFLSKPWDNELLCANVLEAFRLYERRQAKGKLGDNATHGNVDAVKKFTAIEALSEFTTPAAKLWTTIPTETRKILLSNVWCGKCRREVTITNFSVADKSGDLLLVGLCSECHGDVARVIEMN